MSGTRGSTGGPMRHNQGSGDRAASGNGGSDGRRLTRRRFLAGGLVSGAVLAGGGLVLDRSARERVFVGSAATYQADLVDLLLRGLAEVGVGRKQVRGKTLLLKPNLVEPHATAAHINTHPDVTRAAVEAFRRLDAADVWIGEGPGHRRDTLLVLEEAGYLDFLVEDRVRFVDLNQDAVHRLPNAGPYTGMKDFRFSRAIGEADWVVSVAKLKTHHWVGATLSMKNLFGLLPGVVYGWPKNVLHWAGVPHSIIDLNATLRPHLAIVDGVVGMEGDGPILGTPVPAGVLVVGRSPPAVDATCARLMGLDPHKMDYLDAVDGWLGPIGRGAIAQVGERLERHRRDFLLLPDQIESHRGIRLI